MAVSRIETSSSVEFENWCPELAKQLQTSRWVIGPLPMSSH